MYKQIDHEIKKIAKNDQTETILCTYNQNTYTLLYKLSVQSRQSFCFSSFFFLGGGARRVRPRLDPRLACSQCFKMKVSWNVKMKVSVSLGKSQNESE
jgi:hypothetical protein